MDTTLLLAQIFGPLLALLGLSILTNPGLLEKVVKLHDDTAILWVSGLMTVALGLLLVLKHNIWVQNWTVIITILCWLVLVKGVVLIFPFTHGPIIKFGKSMSKHSWIVGIHFLLGLYLSYMAYFA
ncbi:MAG: hypothetical protein Q8P95_00195 [bacterium]|nr:hypothetical protein [bacterium]